MVATMKMIGILAQDIPIQQWIPRLVLPLGFALMLFRFAEVLVSLLRGKDAQLLGDEAADALKYSAHDSDTTNRDQ